MGMVLFLMLLEFFTLVKIPSTDTFKSIPIRVGVGDIIFADMQVAINYLITTKHCLHL